MSTPKNMLLVGLVCAASISCKEPTKEFNAEPATFKAAAGAPTYRDFPLIGSCTMIRNSNQTAGADCIDFYGKVYVSDARRLCQLEDSDQFTHNEANYSTTLVLNQACSHQGMQGGGLYEAGGTRYTSNSDSISVNWYKIDNPSLKNMKDKEEYWIEP